MPAVMLITDGRYVNDANRYSVLQTDSLQRLTESIDLYELLHTHRVKRMAH